MFIDYIIRFLIILLLFLNFSWISVKIECKSTIEPCMTTDSCSSMVGYTLYTDLKVSQVALLFNVDPIQLLAANSYDFFSPGIEDVIIPSNIRMNIPVKCSCSEGIHKAFTKYSSGPSEDISTIARSIYGGLVTEGQIREASSLNDRGTITEATMLTVPLPCTCFNKTDNRLPTMYLSYVVNEEDNVNTIAARYFTTPTDIIVVNSMGTDFISPGDILSIPLSACSSDFSAEAEDYGMLVANGTYAVTAGRCVQCSCGPWSRNIYCMPSPLSVSCSSMQCRRSTLTLGNTTAFAGAAGCSVTSCDYYGLVNSSIWTRISTSLRPRCPGEEKFPQIVNPNSLHSPVPAPTQSPVDRQAHNIQTAKPPTPSGFNRADAPAHTRTISHSILSKRKTVCIFLPLAFLLISL